MIGKTLGQYRIEDKLGSGGMGTVYRARDGQDRVVAVKVVHPHLRGKDGFLERFVKEGAIGQKVIHENVVRTLDAGTGQQDGQELEYLVMEYVEGRTLRELLDELGRFPEALLREVARMVAAGLSAIHEAGIIHRDLKPENVLITEDHQVRIMDLGVARVLEESAALTRDGQFAGSLYYAAPEQFQGRGVGPSTDLYALGVLLYELATGENPFRRDDAAAVVAAHLELVPEALHRRSSDYSAYLGELVGVLLAKDPEARFESALELTRILEWAEDSPWWTRHRPNVPAGLPSVPVRRETALRGREAELESLRSSLDRIRGGRGEVVFIEGEAGIGKTRLVDEFVSDLDLEDTAVLYGSYLPSGGRGGLSSALLDYFGGGDIESALAPYLAETPGLVSGFAALVRHEAAPAGCEPLQREALHTLFVDLMHGLSAERPLIWVVDDLHFASTDSMQLLLSLARAAADHPVLLVLTARPGVSPEELAWFSRLEVFRRLELGRLGARHVIEVLAEAFRSEALAEKLGGKIAYKSDGVPFFVFELIRGLKEGHFIEELPDGSYLDTRVIEKIDVPSAVRDLVAGRLLGLTDDDREILDVAAVQGFEFKPDLLARVCGMKLVRVLQRLASVERRTGVVLCGAGHYRFDHHQIQEILYEEIPPDLRAEYHGMLAEALRERLRGDREEPGGISGELAELLAGNLLRSSRPRDSLPYLKPALEHLETGYRNEAAIDLATQALAADGLLAGPDRFDVLLAKAHCQGHVGRRDAERETLDELMTLVSGSGDHTWRARVGLELGRHYTFTSRPLEALEHLTQALARVADIEDHEVLGSLHGQLGNAYYSLGRYPEAKEEYHAHLEVAERIGDDRGRAAATGSLANILSVTGRHDEAEVEFRRTRELMRAIGNRRGEASSLLNLGTVYTRAGRANEALPVYEQALELVREIGYRRGVAIAAGNLGIMEAHEGHFAAAVKRFQKCLAISREMGDAEGEANALLNLGSILGTFGQLEEAESHAKEALELCAQAGLRRMGGYARGRLGNLAANRRSYQTALDHCRAVIELWEDMGYERGLLAARGDLGYLLTQVGDEEEAIRQLDSALAVEPDSTAVMSHLLAMCHRAALPGGDPGAAEKQFERHGDRLEFEVRMFIRFEFFRMTGNENHLEEAYAGLMHLRRNAPPERRESMLTRVPLHYDIKVAWEAIAGPGGSAPTVVTEDYP